MDRPKHDPPSLIALQKDRVYRFGTKTDTARIQFAFLFLLFTLALLYGRAHTQPYLVQCGRKSGYAPVGMTIHLGNHT